MRTQLGLGILILLLAARVADGATYYVATTGDDTTGNGSVGNPYLTIQKGLERAAPGDTVLVQPGTYSGFRNIDLDYEGQDTIVQSVGGPAVTIIDCLGGGRGIAFGEGETPASLFEGFTVRNGSVGGSLGTPALGGGLACYSSSPTISNCVIENCDAVGSTFLTIFAPAQGGGVYLESSGAIFNNCIIRSNSAVGAANTDNSLTPGYPGSGGGIYADSSSPQFNNCVVYGNIAQGGTSSASVLPSAAGQSLGGGVCLISSFNAVFTNTVVDANEAYGGTHTAGGTNGDGKGGGVYLLETIATFTNVTVSGNKANGLTRPGQGICSENSNLNLYESAVHENGAGITGALGGGLYISNGVDTLRNTTFSSNRALQGAGIYAAAGTVTLLNCTVASNTFDSGTGRGVFNVAATLQLKNTLVAGHGAGGNFGGPITSQGYNLSSDNSVILGGTGDLNNTNPMIGPLQHNGGLTKTHAIPGASPAVDAATNTGAPLMDQRGQPRPADGNGVGGAVTDIGAFELSGVGVPSPTPLATPSPTGSPSASPTRTPTASPTRSPTPSPSPTPSDDAILTGDTLPAQAAVSHDFQYSITLQNTGSTVWSAGSGYFLAVTSDPCGMIAPSGLSIPNGVNVAPGGTITFTGIFTAVPPTGSCYIEFRMASPISGFGPYIGRTISIVDFVNNATFPSDTIPASIAPSKTLGVGITARNTGNTQWIPGGSFRLAVVGDTCGIMPGATVSLIAVTGPAQNHQFVVFITTPAVEGTCDLTLRMEDVGQGLFGAVFQKSIEVAIPANPARDWSVYE